MSKKLITTKYGSDLQYYNEWLSSVMTVEALNILSVFEGSKTSHTRGTAFKALGVSRNNKAYCAAFETLAEREFIYACCFSDGWLTRHTCDLEIQQYSFELSERGELLLELLEGFHHPLGTGCCGCDEYALEAIENDD